MTALAWAFCGFSILVLILLLVALRDLKATERWAADMVVAHAADRAGILDAVKTADANSGYLAAELSKAKNTISLMKKDAEAIALRGREPVKVKSASAIRLAVQRMNSEETEDDA